MEDFNKIKKNLIWQKYQSHDDRLKHCIIEFSINTTYKEAILEWKLDLHSNKNKTRGKCACSYRTSEGHFIINKYTMNTLFVGYTCMNAHFPERIGKLYLVVAKIYKYRGEKKICARCCNYRTADPNSTYCSKCVSIKQISPLIYNLLESRSEILASTRTDILRRLNLERNGKQNNIPKTNIIGFRSKTITTPKPNYIHNPAESVMIPGTNYIGNPLESVIIITKDEEIKTHIQTNVLESSSKYCLFCGSYIPKEWFNDGRCEYCRIKGIVGGIDRTYHKQTIRTI